MDARHDTLLGRFGGQWAFLSNPPISAQPQSLPPSSYLPRSDHSVSAPRLTVPQGFHLNVSRSSLHRIHPAQSISGYTSATLPSQPVLIRINSDEASTHMLSMPRIPRQQPVMSNSNQLPPVSDFSIRGILAAIQEDIEGDIDGIAEILGRSRLALADQHESHMPPQGEIGMGVRPLQGIQEASSSAERLATDNVLILQEDASLVDGSHSGSAAYGLLERLQVVPRIPRRRSETLAIIGPDLAAQRIVSSPAVLPEAGFLDDSPRRGSAPRSSRASRYLLISNSSNDPGSRPLERTTSAVVAETYLLAGANGHTVSNPPVVSEAGRHYPLYSYDESDLFETSPDRQYPVPSTSFRARMQSLLRKSWPVRTYGEGQIQEHGAEQTLRTILMRQQGVAVEEANLEPGEDEDMYD